MQHSSKFFTNRDVNQSLISKFEHFFQYNPTITHFDALVGYFRASGYFKVRPFLQNFFDNADGKVRILVGINIDKLLGAAHQRGQLYFAGKAGTREAFIQSILADIAKAHYDVVTSAGILQFVEDVIDGRIVLRAHPDRRIHAKIYLFYKDIQNVHDTARTVITGSSNFTHAGLGVGAGEKGTGAIHNYEFNVQLNDYGDVRFAYDEFEDLWKDAVPVLPEDATAIQQQSYIADTATPYEVYMKMLMEYFGNSVEYDPYNIETMLPKGYKNLQYQTDAANNGYRTMMEHNGFLLADVVGLGKTIVACMVAKKFVYENGSHTKVLVVVPPAILDGWHTTIDDFQLGNNFNFVTTGSLGKAEWKRKAPLYDLIIIDESHKFRNFSTQMYEDLQTICKTPRAKPSPQGDYTKKVMLLSATPLNNRPEDIENQLYLFQDKGNSTLQGARNLQAYFSIINKKYKAIAEEIERNKENPSPESTARTQRAIQQLFHQLRNEIIEPLVIRRTRKDIESNPTYMADLKKQGIAFPKIDDPIECKYTLTDDQVRLFAETVRLITSVDKQGDPVPDTIGFYRYAAIAYLTNSVYKNPELTAKRLATIMRTLLVKRLESSFTAFTTSLLKFQTAINNMIAMWAKNQILIAPDLNVNLLLEQGFTDEEIMAKMEEIGGNNITYTCADFKPEFIILLKQDKAYVDTLLIEWQAQHDDPKLRTFLADLDARLLNPAYNDSQKLVVFTESIATAELLHEAITAHGNTRSFVVTSKNRKEMEHRIKLNFDANVLEPLQQHNYDIVITTDVLAEGVNMHRSHTIVNYDVPWNATKLMQRIGRVNRIGSVAEKIFVYNYFPSAQGDTQIGLVGKALRKLQSFHAAFGEDNRIFSLLEEVGEGGFHGKAVENEESEIFKYLKILKAFKAEQPEQYQKVRNMPYKTRVGTAATHPTESPFGIITAEMLPEYLPNTTIAYLKANNHKGVFCFVAANGTTEQLSFLQAVKLFEADSNTPRTTLHEAHHKQTIIAFDDFQHKQAQEQYTQRNATQLSATEKEANSLLVTYNKLTTTPEQRTQIATLRQKITDGSTRSLPKEIVAFHTKEKAQLAQNANNFITLFLNTVAKNVLLDKENTNLDATAPEKILIEPHIVLSVSFL